MSARVIEKTQYRRATWKNGLGYTDEIAIHPEGAELKRGDFLWRLSSARIEQASAFSSFPEHDRTLVILNGRGLRMTHTFNEGEEESVEVPPLSPYEFPGDVPSRCELISGAVTDLSVFARKGEVEAVTESVELEQGEDFTWLPSGRWNFIYLAQGDLVVTTPGNGTEERVTAGDTYFVELDEALTEETALLISAPRSGAQFVVVGLQG